ncbi:unnamed protein product [Pipistrellus nathusii]|uniref:Uncharacterized protein n=1 Tax=Pipistrellus nathusii TaxID=59473 RepID=A0ABN9ZNQ6_PIPNA
MATTGCVPPGTCPFGEPSGQQVLLQPELTDAHPPSTRPLMPPWVVWAGAGGSALGRCQIPPGKLHLGPDGCSAASTRAHSLSRAAAGPGGRMVPGRWVGTGLQASWRGAW